MYASLLVSYPNARLMFLLHAHYSSLRMAELCRIKIYCALGESCNSVIKAGIQPILASGSLRLNVTSVVLCVENQRGGTWHTFRCERGACPSGSVCGCWGMFIPGMLHR